MNKRQKIVVIIWGVLILSTLIVWWSSGGEIWTKDQVKVEKEMTEIDKMLGREPLYEYQDKFLLGLLPHTAVVLASITVISGILFILFRNKKNKETK